MFKDKNTIYSEAGSYLRYENQIGFQFPDGLEVEEYDLNLDDLNIIGNTIYYNNNTIAHNVIPHGKYGDYKSSIIKKRYSNDDQIAIILNKEDSEEDAIKYDKMMEWRSFAAELAKKIMNI